MDKIESAIDRYNAVMEKADMVQTFIQNVRQQNILRTVKRMQQLQADAQQLQQMQGLISPSVSVPTVKLS